MLHRLAQYWWLLLVRGLVSIAFAVIAFLNPTAAFELLVMLLGIFLFADGLIALMMGLRMRNRDEDWWMVALEGLVGIGLGAVCLLMPEITATGIVLMLALWFLITGVFEIGTAIKMRAEIDNEWLLGSAGLVSVLLGGIMLFRPSIGTFSLGMWMGIYALVFGILLVGLGLRVRASGRM